MNAVTGTLRSFEDGIRMNERYDPATMFVSVAKVSSGELPGRVVIDRYVWPDNGFDGEDEEDEDDDNDDDSSSVVGDDSNDASSRARPDKRGDSQPTNARLPAAKLVR